MLQGKILIVDDDAAVRLVTAAMLERLNYTAVAVASGVAALEVCDLETFDAMLLDLAMPDMTGVELQALLRTRCPRLTVVVMTGYADAETTLQINSDSETRFLAKPFTVAELDKALSTSRKVA